MRKLDISLSEFCAAAIEEYGRTEVCDAICSLMTALALETDSSEYYAAIDDAIATFDGAKSEALAGEVAEFVHSVGQRYGEETSAFELIDSLASAAARSHDDMHIRRIGEVYLEKAAFYRRLLGKARH